MMNTDFMDGLEGGFQGAGTVAPLAAQSGNPWAAAGILGAGALVGVLHSQNPAAKKARKTNARLGEQEVAMNDLTLEQKRAQVDDEARKRRAWGQFGTLFSGYLSGMLKAQPSGMAQFQQDLGGNGGV